MRRKQKSKLVKLMESPRKGNYETTIEDCNKWFKIINEEIFSNKLTKIDAIYIGWRRKTYAYYVSTIDDEKEKYIGELYMNKKYESIQQFVAILCHELIHHHQHINKRKLDHGSSFHYWIEKFNRKGLRGIK